MSEHYYRFLRRQKLKPRKPKLAYENDDPIKAINWVIKQKPDHVFYDLETTGLNYADPNQVITTIGMATPDWCVGIDLMHVPFTKQRELWAWLSHQQLGGFNLGFDAAWPWRRKLPDGRVDPQVQHLDLFSDTLLWFRLLATEAHVGQNHSLETLIDRVLGWPKEYQQKDWLKSKLKEHGLSRNQMYGLAALEPEEYTRYCALDAEASYQAHDVFQQVLKQNDFDGLNRYWSMVLAPKIKRNIKATCSGIKVDREKLSRNLEWVKSRRLTLEAQLLESPEMIDYLVKWESDKVASMYALKPSYKKVWAKQADEPWNDPVTWRLQLATEDKVDKLPAWCRPFGGKFWKPETKFAIKGETKEWPRFNVNSTVDMKHFIYEHLLGGQYDVWYRNEEKKEWGGLVTVTKDNKQYQVDLTQGGGLPTGGDILVLFGQFGGILNEYKALGKLEGDFLQKYYDASARTGYVHPQSKILGTATGRESGGN